MDLFNSVKITNQQLRDIFADLHGFSSLQNLGLDISGSADLSFQRIILNFQ